MGPGRQMVHCNHKRLANLIAAGRWPLSPDACMHGASMEANGLARFLSNTFSKPLIWLLLSTVPQVNLVSGTSSSSAQVSGLALNPYCHCVIYKLTCAHGLALAQVLLLLCCVVHCKQHAQLYFKLLGI